MAYTKAQIRKMMRQRLAARGTARGAAAKRAGVKVGSLGKDFGPSSSLKGLGLSKEEKAYAKKLRRTQPHTAKRKTAYKSAVKAGRSPEGLEKLQMKSTRMGGTVGKGTHSTGAALTEAKTWKSGRTAKLKAAQKAGKISQSELDERLGKVGKRYQRMTG